MSMKKSVMTVLAVILTAALTACGSSGKNTDVKVSGMPDPEKIENAVGEPSEVLSAETPSPEEPAGSFESSLYVAEVQEDREIPTSYWVTFYDDYTGSFLRSIDGYVREELEEFDFTWEYDPSGALTAHAETGEDIIFTPVPEGLLIKDRGVVLQRSSVEIESKL